MEPNQERAYPLLSDCLFSQNTPRKQHHSGQLYQAAAEVNLPASQPEEKLTKAAAAGATVSIVDGGGGGISQGSSEAQQQEPNNNNDEDSTRSQDRITPDDNE